MATNPFLNQAQQLFDIYATGYDPGQQGLEFWANKFAAPGADTEAIRREFVNPAIGSSAPRFGAMQLDPDYLAAIGKGPASPMGQAKNLFSTYATDFTPDQQALDYWSSQIQQRGYENVIPDFLMPQDKNAPRAAALMTDPDRAKGLQEARQNEAWRQYLGTVGEQNRLELDKELRKFYNQFTGGKGMANPIEDYISMLSGRDTTDLNRDYAAAKQRMRRDAQLAGLLGGEPTSTTAYEMWAMKQQPEAKARELFKTYATGMEPTQEAIDFWTSRFADPKSTYQSVVQEFLNPQNRQAARISTLETDPTARAAKGLMSLPGAQTTIANEQVLGDLQKKVTPTTEGLGPGDKEIVDRNFEGDADLAREAANDAAKATPTTPTKEAKEIVDREKVDTSNFPKFEGTPYDPKAYDSVLKQLTAQQKALESKGVKYVSSFGGAEQTLQDMAKRLAAMGISDIRDFGQKFEIAVEKEEPYLMYQDEGAPIQVDTGKYKTIDGIEGYTSEREPIYKYRYLTDDEVKKLKRNEGGDLSLVLDQSNIPDNPYATTLYYNKKTGEILDSRKFGSKAENGIWASSGAGDGFTDYRVMFTKEGVPVFMPQKQFSGMKEFVTEDLQGILSVLRFLPGAQIPVMLAQAASAAYMGADPKDILKNLATSYIASNLGNIIAGGADKLGIQMPTSELGKLATQGGIGALSTLIQGGDLEQALKSGVLTAAGSGISSLLPKGDGTFDYAKIIQALAPAVARGELSNADVFRLIGSLIPGDESKKKKVPVKP